MFAIHPFSHSLSTFGMPPVSQALVTEQETKQVWALPPGDLGPVVETVKLCEGRNCVFGTLLGSQRLAFTWGTCALRYLLTGKVAE